MNRGGVKVDSERSSHTSVAGSEAFVAGLTKMLFWPLLIGASGVIAAIFFLLGGSPLGAAIVYGLTALVALAVTVYGTSQFIDGTSTLVQLLERFLRQERDTEIGSLTSVSVLGLEPQTAHRVRTSDSSREEVVRHAIAQETVKSNRGPQEPFGTPHAAAAVRRLLGDPEVAQKADELKRMYGRSVVASYLTRRAREAGLRIDQILESDLPADF